jgi:catechol 2,3-dioxygenase-like lactoylglutathione lyase family enzyme
MHAVLTHIAVHVADVDACVAFYQEYAGLIIVKERIPTNTTLTAQTSQRIVWLAEQDKSQDFIIVVLPNGVLKPQAEQDFSHLGFAMASKLAVDQIAAQAQQQ